MARRFVVVPLFKFIWRFSIYYASLAPTVVSIDTISVKVGARLVQLLVFVFLSSLTFW